jgi:hypothetical protein
MNTQPPQIEMEVVTDPKAIAEAQAQDARYKRNLAWLNSHFTDVYSTHRGKCICVAGEELFVADSPRTVFEMAQKAHPEDNGRIIRYIPLDKMDRIYAN